MGEKDTKVQKKQKLVAAGMGAGAVILGVALTGGTSAYLFDDETDLGNFQAGTLDVVTSGSVQGISLNPKANVTYDPTTKKLTARNLQPGDKFKYTIAYTNAGTLNGVPQMSWKISNDSENGTGESETGADIGSAEQGELDNLMTVEWNIDATESTPNGIPQNIHALETNPVFGLGPVLAPGATRQSQFTLTVPKSASQGAENNIMTDSFDLTVTVGLAQQG